jgi:hypothetical protein
MGSTLEREAPFGSLNWQAQMTPAKFSCQTTGCFSKHAFA